MTKIDVNYFCNLFEIDRKNLPKFLYNLIISKDFNYSKIDSKEEINLIKKINDYIKNENLSVVGPKRNDLWERCWKEQLEKFINSGYDLNYLTPKFIYSGKPVRLNDFYIWPNDPNFETNYIDVCRSLVFYKHFSSFSNIYEFGCGSGYNLVRFSSLFPNKNIVGLDWSLSSVDLVNKFSKFNNLKIRGEYFDFFKPNYDISFPNSTVVFTQTALEQVGNNFKDFLDFLIQKKPGLCVHIEPIVELYDLKVSSGKLAYDYSLKRNYLSGFLPELQRQEKKGYIKIVDIRRTNSGGLYHESSLLVWKPLI